MNKPLPDFAILQNDKTKQTGIWSDGKWKDAPKEDYVILGLIAKLLRTAPNPVDVIKSINLYNDKKKQSYKNQFDWEPGFFIPPEELDGLEQRAGLPGMPGNTPPALDKPPFMGYIIVVRETKTKTYEPTLEVNTQRDQGLSQLWGRQLPRHNLRI